MHPATNRTEISAIRTAAAFRAFQGKWAMYRLERAALDFRRAIEGKYNFDPNQPRVPAGNSHGGEWAGRDGGASSTNDETFRIANRRRPPAQFPGASPAQRAILEVEYGRARQAIEKARKLDPNWKPRPSATSRDIGGAIARFRAEKQEAEAYFREISRDAVPGFNPLWGVNRLRKELYRQGFRLRAKSKRGIGHIYENNRSGEIVKIMQKPRSRYRKDPQHKHSFRYYYRYRRSATGKEGAHTPIPD